MKTLIARLTFLLVNATACASSPPALRGQPVAKSIAIHVSLSDEASRTDELGGTATLVETVSAGLTDRGLRNDIFTRDDDRPPAPRIELRIEEWDGGSSGERATGYLVGGLIGTVATAGSYAVVCRIYRDGDTKPVFTKRYSGAIIGVSDTDSASVAEHVGRHIVGDALD